MTEYKVKRQSLRFPPEPNTLLYAQSNKGEISVGLAFSEAHKGCGGIFTTKNNLVEGETYEIKIGEIEGVFAVLRWLKVLDTDVVKAGFEFIN